MKRLLIFVLVIISIHSFGQNPGNYTYINGKYRWQAGIFDSTFRLPRYNGVPSGLRNGEWSTMDGALAADTLNGHIYRYHNTTWARLAMFADIAQRFGVTGEDRIAGQNRTFSGLNHTYSFRFDSLDTWDVARNGTQRMYVNSTATGLYSPNGLNAFQVFDDSIQLKQISGNYSIYNLPQRFDTSANKVLTWNASTLKLGWSSYFGGGGGSGTVNSGAALKAAYYPSAAALVDDWVGVEFGNTNINTKITAQATTEVPLEIHLAGSQTAHAFKVINSSAADLTYIEADGDLVFTTNSGKQITSTGTEVIIRETGDTFGEAGFKLRNRSGSAGGVFYNNGLDLVDLGFLTSTAEQFNFRYEHRSGEFIPGNTNGEFQFIKSSSSNVFGRFGEAYGAFEGSFLIGGADEEVPGAKLHIEGAEGTDATFLLDADDGDDDADSWFVKSVASDNTLTFTNHTNIRSVLSSAGAWKFNAYGSGTFTGTPTRFLAVDADGDVIESTASSLKPALNKAVTIESPSSSEAIDMWQTPVAITVTSLKAILRGSSPSVTYNIRFGTDITSSTDVFTANITCTSTTTGCSNSTGFNDATIPAGSFIWVITSAASGTIASISLTLNYTED